jgi:beta-glucosidase
MGFRGFVVSDWMAINQLDRDYYTCVVKTINAGLDMIMVPYDYKLFITTLTQAAEKGDVSITRIDDAVRRILRAKFWLGLFEKPVTDESLLKLVGAPEHRAVAREAVRKSLVLLKNDALLPLPKNAAKILVGGRGADNIGMQCGGWSIDWLGSHGPIAPGDSILDGIRQTVSQTTEILHDETGEFDMKAEIGIAVVGEDPYAEGFGDNGHLTLTEGDITAINRMREQCEKLVVILLSGRPLLIADQLAQSDAFVAAWLPGTEGQGVADVLFGDYPFTGKLSYSWPRSIEQVPLKALKAHNDGPLFPFGYSL